MNRDQKGYMILILGMLTACASLSFNFKSYGLQAQNYDGKLLAAKPENDLSLKMCEPNDQYHGKCVVMMADEYYRMKTEHTDLEERLKDCEASQ